MKCNYCDKEHEKGYILDGGEYYCSKDCLQVFIDDNEYEELHEFGLLVFGDYKDLGVTE